MDVKVALAHGCAQMCAAVFVCAEREVMEACVRQLESPSLAAGVRDLLGPLVTLFAAASVERELSWYIAQEVVPARVSKMCCGMISRVRLAPPVKPQRKKRRAQRVA